MAKIYQSSAELIGHTPLVELKTFAQMHNARARIIAKLESFNPMSSVKDRVALALIEGAEQSGLLNADTTIIEPTSGNTGIGLAYICAIKKYRLIIVMPDTMSIERQMLLRALGAELVLTPGAKGMTGAIEEAKRLRESSPNAISLNQFDNPSNPAIHRKTTAQEIWQDTDGELDIFIAGVGTGGTLMGVSSFLREAKPNIRIIAVEPASSPVLSGGSPSPHQIQGIGAGFIPKIYDPTLVDEIIRVNNEDAFARSRELAKTEGILAGISSGAALQAAVEQAQLVKNIGKTIVVVLPDSGERYLSTSLFQGR